jgi:hypothetical protein
MNTITITTQYHLKNENDSLIYLPPTTISNYENFGIVNLKVNDVPMNHSPLFILFSCDISGSMSDSCVDGSSKIEHAIHTIRNILILFAEKSEENIEIWVQVVGFDDKIVDVISPQRVTSENVDLLLTKLKKMRPRNGTNIELAMNNANELMHQFAIQHPDFHISHIFTTDGNPTCGNCDSKYLAALVNSQYMNTFIGYGYDHSARLLNQMSCHEKAQYYFIDKIENGGLVFGEIIHSILYRALTDVWIHIKNGVLYNYVTNQWEDQLMVGSLAGEADKVYHLCSSSQEECILEVTGTVLTSSDTLLVI